MDTSTAYEPRRRRLALPASGGEIALLDFGPPDRPVDLVFSHANGFNASAYRSVLAPLAARLRIVAYDLRGHGASSLPAEPHAHPGWGVFAEDLLALLQAEAAGPVVLAGHSMGGMASLLAAAARPEVVRSLVLFDPVFFPGVHRKPAEAWAGHPLVEGALRRRTVFASRAEALDAYAGRGAFRTWPQAALADYVAAGFRDRTDGRVELACAPEWEAANYAVHRYDPEAALMQSRCPVRILKAEHGSTVAIAASPDPQRIVVETIAGASHFLPLERGDLVEAALLAAAA